AALSHAGETRKHGHAATYCTAPPLDSTHLSHFSPAYESCAISRKLILLLIIIPAAQVDVRVAVHVDVRVAAQVDVRVAVRDYLAIIGESGALLLQQIPEQDLH